MGNESSQLEGDRQHRAPNQHARVIGPSMSPSPSDSGSNYEGRVFGPAMSPLPSDGEADHPDNRVSPPRSPVRKKKSRRKKDADGNGNGTLHDENVHRSQPDALSGDLQTSKRKSKGKKKKASAHQELQTDEHQEPHIKREPGTGEDDLVEFPAAYDAIDPQLYAIGEVPPSAQPYHHESTPQARQNGRAAVIPSQANEISNQDPVILSPTHIKTEAGEDAHSGDAQSPAELAGLGFADAGRDPAATDDTQSPADFSWLHKRHSQNADATPARQNTTNRGRASETLPELRPGQSVQEAPPSDSDLPSPIKSERLSQSRSPSISSTPPQPVASADRSVASAVNSRQLFKPLAEQPNYRNAVAGTPSTRPSSTGSNTSIPARLDDDFPASAASLSQLTPNTQSSARKTEPEMPNEPVEDVQPLDVDEPVAPKEPAKRSSLGKRKASRKSSDNINAGQGADNTQQAEETITGQANNPRKKANRRRLSVTFAEDHQPEPVQEVVTDLVPDDELPIEDMPVPEVIPEPISATSQPPKISRRKGKSSLAQTNGERNPEDNPPAASANSESTAQPQLTGEDTAEPTASATQPRKTPKRKARASLPVASEAHETPDASATPAAPVDGAAEASPSISQSQKTTRRKTKISLAREDGNNNPTIDATGNQPASTSEQTGENGVPNSSTEAPSKPSAGGIPQAVSQPDAARISEDTAEPGESASQLQPKNKKKRRLQAKKTSQTMSLSQLEGDEGAPDGQSRLPAFSQKPKLKDTMRGGSNEPEGSEDPVSQAQSPVPKPRKTRKRRRPDDESEDELQGLVAGGSSRSPKKGRLDEEDADTVTRKRAGAKDKATGPWRQDELSALGRVVNDFRDSHNMTQQEVNKMIHQVPDKQDSIKSEFWNRVSLAIPQRTKKQIVERTRRLYHNFVARGTWTEEQKEEVHELFEQHPKKWVEIGGIINRDPKDVRDYWRNNYLVHDHQIKARWNKEDAIRLKDVVEEALIKIRISRENNGERRSRNRGTEIDDETLLDWQQISAAMGLTRSRQQCKWKWTDMREKGWVADESIDVHSQPRVNIATRGQLLKGNSEELISARKDYEKMSDEEKFLLVESILETGGLDDGHIRWANLVDEAFRAKWRRSVLKITWYRLRRTVPDYEKQLLNDNARWLFNYYTTNQCFPKVEDHMIDEQAEELLVHGSRGKRIWHKPSIGLRAIRERQRRSAKVSDGERRRRPTQKVSSNILKLDGSGDEDDDDEDEDEDEDGQGHGSGSESHVTDSAGENIDDGQGHDDVPIKIPKHLEERAAKRAAAAASKRDKAVAARGARSASVAVDSESE